MKRLTPPHTSFFCSALESCRLNCGEAMQIYAFYIRPQELAPGCEFVEDIYKYFASKASPAFRVVRT